MLISYETGQRKVQLTTTPLYARLLPLYSSALHFQNNDTVLIRSIWQVIGAHFEKVGSKAFAVYSIRVKDADNLRWTVQRRYF